VVRYSHTKRVTTIRHLDDRIEDLKERLRLTHDLGVELVAEIVRLEREKERYLLHNEPPALLLVKSA
jgi:hypothetical protein